MEAKWVSIPSFRKRWRQNGFQSHLLEKDGGKMGYNPIF
jgi:hypothetical protein